MTVENRGRRERWLPFSLPAKIRKMRLHTLLYLLLHEFPFSTKIRRIQEMDDFFQLYCEAVVRTVSPLPASSSSFTLLNLLLNCYDDRSNHLQSPRRRPQDSCMATRRSESDCSHLSWISSSWPIPHSQIRGTAFA